MITFKNLKKDNVNRQATLSFLILLNLNLSKHVYFLFYKVNIIAPKKFLIISTI